MSEALRLWLSQELDRRGLSHNELARQVGFSQAFVSNVMKGERKPSINFCNKVAQALGVSPETLMRLAGILPPAPPASATDNTILQELVELARHLSPDHQQQVLDYIRFISRSQ